MEALADRVRSRGIDVVLNADLDYEAGRVAVRHEAELETALYRIAQEAMTNAFKHSGAESVTVDIQEAQGHVTLRVHDDGQGFDASGTSGGFGLMSMRERVELLDGTLTIDSAPGAGTTLTARLPAVRRAAASDAPTPPRPTVPTARPPRPAGRSPRRRPHAPSAHSRGGRASRPR